LKELAPSLLTAEVSAQRKFRAQKRWEKRASGQSRPIATVNADVTNCPFQGTDLVEKNVFLAVTYPGAPPT
jgi:hypothetical protein